MFARFGTVRGEDLPVGNLVTLERPHWAVNTPIPPLQQFPDFLMLRWTLQEVHNGLVEPFRVCGLVVSTEYRTRAKCKSYLLVIQ